MVVQPVPEGYHTVTPYLMVDDCDRQIAFLTAAFGATTKERMTGPDGSVAHAEVVIGDSHVMMGQGRDEWKAMPCMLYLYVPDTDSTYARAIEAGAESVQEPTDMFYGDRNAGVKDPLGNMLFIATHQEDLTPEELQKRAEKAHGPTAS